MGGCGFVVAVSPPSLQAWLSLGDCACCNGADQLPKGDLEGRERESNKDGVKAPTSPAVRWEQVSRAIINYKLMNNN